MPDILKQNLELVRRVSIGSLRPEEYFWVSRELRGKAPLTLENGSVIEDCTIRAGAYQRLGPCIFHGFGVCWYEVVGSEGNVLWANGKDLVIDLNPPKMYEDESPA